MHKNSIEFMRDLESRFKSATQLPDRSRYKIFYGQVHPAKILALGINPGGDPQNTNTDGQTHKDGKIAAASGSYFENGEHDILDCEWPENKALRPLLAALVGGDATRIRADVVKTNLAFRRSAKATDINIDCAIAETAPFLAEIIDVVKPELILLTGPAISKFAANFASKATVIVPPAKDPGVKQTVFAASRLVLRNSSREVLAVQLSHASQFGWTYKKYAVSDQILALMQGA